MNEAFRLHVEALHPAYERLIAAEPFTFDDLDEQSLPARGVYLFSEGDKHLYVGRTNNLKKRLRHHCGDKKPHNQASFAFLLALEICGTGKATYKAESSRKVQVAAEPLKGTFSAQKARLRLMNIRTVEETDANRQALLELYASIALTTPYNDFDNH